MKCLEAHLRMILVPLLKMIFQLPKSMFLHHRSKESLKFSFHPRRHYFVGVEMHLQMKCLEYHLGMTSVQRPRTVFTSHRMQNQKVEYRCRQLMINRRPTLIHTIPNHPLRKPDNDSTIPTNAESAAALVEATLKMTPPALPTQNRRWIPLRRCLVAEGLLKATCSGRLPLMMCLKALLKISG